jgi:hypothetical protein
VRPLPERSPLIENGHLVSPSRMFNINLNASYAGIENVRGIECDRWHATYSEQVGNSHFNYSADYYFAVRNWRVSGVNEHHIPVR